MKIYVINTGEFDETTGLEYKFPFSDDIELTEHQIEILNKALIRLQDGLEEFVCDAIRHQTVDKNPYRDTDHAHEFAPRETVIKMINELLGDNALDTTISSLRDVKSFRMWVINHLKLGNDVRGVYLTQARIRWTQYIIDHAIRV